MVDLVLNDLRRPAGERFNARLELLILPLHLDGLITLCFPRAGQGQAALLRVIGRGFFDDHRIEHDHVITIVVERNNALVDADHIRRHAHAAILVRGQRIQQVLRQAQIVRRGRLRLLGQEKFVFADITDHGKTSAAFFLL